MCRRRHSASGSSTWEAGNYKLPGQSAVRKRSSGGSSWPPWSFSLFLERRNAMQYTRRRVPSSPCVSVCVKTMWREPNSSRRKSTDVMIHYRPFEERVPSQGSLHYSFLRCGYSRLNIGQIQIIMSNDIEIRRYSPPRHAPRRTIAKKVTISSFRDTLKAVLHNPVAKTLPRPCLGSQN